jgi:hypothetical protein
LTPILELKRGQNNPKNRRTLSFEKGLIVKKSALLLIVLQDSRRLCYTIFMRLIGKVFAGLAIFFAIALFCHSQTAGFSLDKIAFPPSIDQIFSLKTEAAKRNEEGEREIVKVLDQPFFFLGKGRTAYAFVSQDGLYVVKFVRYNHLRPPFWFKWLPSLFNPYKERVENELKQKLERNFCGHILGFENLQKETQLLYLHLNPTAHLNKKLFLFDKIGNRHEVNLDHLAFVVQRKVGLICEELSYFMKEGHPELAKESLDHLLQMVIERQQKGIFDRDPNVHLNYGLNGTTPVLIDTGGLLTYHDYFLLKPRSSHSRRGSGREEIYSKTVKFRRWLSKKYPEINIYFEEKIALVPDLIISSQEKNSL